MAKGEEAETKPLRAYAYSVIRCTRAVAKKRCLSERYLSGMYLNRMYLNKIIHELKFAENGRATNTNVTKWNLRFLPHKLRVHVFDVDLAREPIEFTNRSSSSFF